MGDATPQQSEWPDLSKIYANSALAEESIKDCDRRSIQDRHSHVSLLTEESMDGLSNNPSSYHTLSQMECSTAAPSVAGTDFDEDVDDDEILAWVASGMLPVNKSTTLALNQAYQEILEQFMGRIEGVLTQIRERQKVVQNLIDQSYSTDSDIKPKKANKVPVLLYVCPYFRDSSSLCPGLNAESKKMRENGHYFDMLVEQRTKWSTSEKAQLKRGVAHAVRNALLSPIRYRKELLCDKTNADDVKVVQAKKYTESIKDLDKQIAKVNALSDTQLGHLSTDCEIDWGQIASEYMDTTRTAIECECVWFNNLLPHLSTDGDIKWSKQEMDKLKKFVSYPSYSSWNSIASSLGTGKTAFECFEEYQSELNTSLIRREWTKEEDEKLKEAVEQFRIGTYIPWNQIPFFVDGKTRDQCQRRYVQCLDPRLRRGRWLEEEDLLLMRAVQTYGERDWARIAEFVGTRSYIQCRERWCLTLNSNFSGDVWTKTEDATLLLGAASFGVGSWTKIAQLLPGRSSAMCKQRYKSLRNNNAATDGKSNCITINLLEEESLASKMEVNRQKKRRNNLNSRKERVKHWYKQEHGIVPNNRKPPEVSSFLQSLPDSHRKLIREKLLLIQNIYGTLGKQTRKPNAIH